MHVEARWRSPARVATDPRRREHELPCPLGRRMRVLPIERERQDGPPESTGEITCVVPLDVLQVANQPRDHR